MNLWDCMVSVDPGRTRKWKENVRRRHHSRPLKAACEHCGATGAPGFLTRHHNWAAASPGAVAAPRTLCRPCHDAIDGARPTGCPVCGKRYRSYGAAQRHGKRVHGLTKRQFARLSVRA